MTYVTNVLNKHHMAGVVQGGWFGKARASHHVLRAAWCASFVAQKLVQVACALEPEALPWLQVAHSVSHHSHHSLWGEGSVAAISCVLSVIAWFILHCHKRTLCSYYRVKLLNTPRRSENVAFIFYHAWMAIICDLAAWLLRNLTKSSGRSLESLTSGRVA